MTAEDTGRKRTLARKLAVDLSVMSVLGVLMAVIGPFGSFEQPFVTRLAMWLGLAYAGYAVYAPLGVLVARIHRQLDLPRAGLWIAGVLLATVPMAAIVWSLNGLYGPLSMPDPETALTHYLNVLVVGGAVTVLFQLLGRDSTRPPPTHARSDGIAKTGEDLPPRFLDRLPPSLGTDLQALEMEDHYVRAHTALGSDLVLLRLRDAVAELDAAEGLQVHRSWWVARGAVEEIRREGRNVRLVLANGVEVPVSRTNVQMLRDAGWI
ncbi:LytTR family transcriptional regulator [Erythrobacter vulgaris]|uniref:LytTR family transcriptional regulator n=1 Tax=Qipengyuania vulgaris TaxID=291985 RepID=A0A844XRM7_9SPHN|nr:LytTR family DNA-binding domain-containing protein [Qipengyuania vulgaris]MXO48785.1 LytTR family transcriptional regulator [Qipengyuania vulgaris]